MRRLPVSTLAAFAVCALAVLCASPAAAQRNAERTPCRSDRYFVHVPTFADPAGVPSSFAPDLFSAVDPHIPRNRLGVRQYTIAAIGQVLPARAVDERQDGERRFWQVRLDREIGPERACRFVDALRTEAEALLPGTPIYVGRECGASGYGAAPDPESPDWHLEAMGVPAPLPVGEEPGDVALVDTGFLWPPHYQADPAFGPAMHPHGQAMAELIHHVDPAIPVRDYRALDSDGHGDLAHVARAIDAAVFDATGPRAINLSLGWPPELERVRAFDAGECSTREDPAGEAVRYALAMARLRDEGRLHVGGQPRPQNGPTAVIAAAGNRGTVFGGDSTFVYEAFYRTTDGAGDQDPCSSPGADDLFYPAQWARRTTCLIIGGGSWTIDGAMTTPVAATDARDLPSSLTPQVPLPRLMAPGVNVLAAGTRWTGSSVSAALVSGAVARAFGEGATDATEAVDLVYAGSTPLPAIDPGTRRLAFPLAYAAAPAIPSPPPALQVDGALAGTWTSADIGDCLQRLADWAADTADFADVKASCPAFLHHLDQFSAGRAGPQPPEIGCPDCLAGLYLGLGDKADVQIELTNAWDPATSITKPHLYIEWPDGQYVWTALPDGPQWTPGGQFVIKGLTVEHPGGTLSLGDLAAGGKMLLLLEVQTPKQTKPSTDMSDITMKAL